MKALSRRRMLSAVAVTAAAAGPASWLGRGVAGASELPGVEVVTGPATFTASDGTTIVDVPLTTSGTAIGTTDISGEGHASQFHEVVQEQPFSMLGVTWLGPGTLDGQLRVRRGDGSWGPWTELDGGHGPNEVSEPTTNDVRNGTDLVFFGETTAAQIHVRGRRTAGVNPGTAPDSPLSSLPFWCAPAMRRCLVLPQSPISQEQLPSRM